MLTESPWPPVDSVSAGFPLTASKWCAGAHIPPTADKITVGELGPAWLERQRADLFDDIWT
jgi:hypothetical protein